MGILILCFLCIIVIPACLGTPPDEVLKTAGIFICAYIVIWFVGSLIKSIEHEKEKKAEAKRILSGGYNTPFEYEQYVANWLLSKGYINVQVTQKTGDYGADIICFDRNGVKYAVQCKYYSNPVGYHAVEEVLGAMHYYGCFGAMVVTNNTYTKQAFEASKKTGVKLFEHVI